MAGCHPRPPAPSSVAAENCPLRWLGAPVPPGDPGPRKTLEAERAHRARLAPLRRPGPRAPRGSHLAKIFLAMRVRAVLVCCLRSVSPGCRLLLPLPLPPALAEPRSTPVAASTSRRNSGSRQSANRTRSSESTWCQPERLSPEPRPLPDTGPPGSLAMGAGGRRPLLSAESEAEGGPTARTGRGAAGGPGARPAASSEPSDRKAAEASGWGTVPSAGCSQPPGWTAPPGPSSWLLDLPAGLGRPLCWSAGHLATCVENAGTCSPTRSAPPTCTLCSQARGPGRRAEESIDRPG